MTPLIVAIAAFIGVAALVGGVAMLFRGQTDSHVEDRLELLAHASVPGASKELKSSVLHKPLEDVPDIAARFFAKFANLTLLFEQAETTLTPSKFLAISGGLAVASGAMVGLCRLHPGLIPLGAAAGGVLPLMWLVFRRRRRLNKFAQQLPDALELVARALRAGHSLAAGFHLVSEEMSEPIATEFGRVFEEQNLGIPLEEALTGATERVPNLDLKFFTTAIILQRQTGGDLAEILDKIGRLIRERFKIWGQVQALTGEGRLSGVVLLALPPVLFVTVYRMNPEYMMILFSDELGKQMLVGGVISQIVGALVIRKIVNIKV